MAMTIANTDPRTLEAAFIAQAHSTALSAESRLGSVATGFEMLL